MTRLAALACLIRGHQWGDVWTFWRVGTEEELSTQSCYRCKQVRRV